MTTATVATHVRSPGKCIAPVDSFPSAPQVVTLTARHRAMWDMFVRAHSQGTFFHTIGWMESVRDAFGHQPHYLLAHQDGKTVGVLPLFQIDSLLAGTMLVSVPYAVAGGILADTPEARDALWKTAITKADEIGAGTIELRSEARVLDGLMPIDRHVTFKRELPDRVEDVLTWLPRKARAAARNGQNKHGLSVEYGDVYLSAVWRLYGRSMRRLGSICYPYSFFEGLLERNRADTHVQVVRHGDRIVAGLVSFRFGHVFLPYFAGCDERFNGLNTNNFLYMSAMRRAVDVGCKVFDFGRTRTDNKGSFDFKRFHGFHPQPLGYQRYVIQGGKSPDLAPSNPKFRLARRLWRHLPRPVCTRLGMWVSHHIPG